ncbi:MAG TPA: hypothetical protein DCL80_13575 [Balneola sp.]|jgi:hypothetical protein|nr:hypothetical protein [Balneola sp.]MAO76651.1 hypothetical protein [Balneola sp.]MBF65058.1 hypothetical protein [Balneola sp.]HAH52217.1 hypothetical protein [Balneola sp.]HAW79252.1 hypothetical protein [Balneola sp.]|tara:strand:+ start:12689 stop:13792 length:1104 start_codon:yes stop_codon:yes gene_type:complete
MLSIKLYKIKNTSCLKSAFYLLFLLVLACDTKKENNIIQVKGVHEFTLSDETQEHLVSIYTQVVDNPVRDELLFTNHRSEVGVVITDYEGNFIEKVGKKGRGPKEIESSRNFGAKNEKKVVILDKAQSIFKEYNRESGEVELFTYPVKDGISITSRNLTFCSEKWFAGLNLLTKPALTTAPTIAVFDTSFVLVDTLGGYDPFFAGRKDILQETTYDLNCEESVIYTAQGKTPNIQVFSVETGKKLGSTSKKPSSFNISDTFIQMVSSPQEMTKFLSEEQSISLHVAHNDNLLFLIFRNDHGVYKRIRVLNESEHFVAVYDRKNLKYIGETKLDGAILGSTKNGYLIMLKDENEMKFELIDVSVKPSK